MKPIALWGALPLALALTAGVQAAPLKVQGGSLPLPTSGIVITVADDPARDYMLSGSWAIDDAGSFDSRDVIDELDAKSGALVRGNWVLTGYFNAKTCDALLAGLGQKNSWTAPVTMWGSSWQASGGDYTFNNDLGTRPMTALCRMEADGRGLVLQRFLIDRPAGMTKAAMLAELGQARILTAAAKAYAAGTVRASPTPRPGNLTNRGKVAAARLLKLDQTRLDLTLPDDGSVWMVGKEEEKTGSDRLDRMVPSMPDVSVEVARIAGTSCAAAWGQFKLPTLTPAQKAAAARPLTGVPSGWATGPMLASGAQLERIVCMMQGSDALLAGYIAERNIDNAAPIAGLLTALAAAKAN